VYDASAVLRRWRPVLAAAFASREDLLDLPPPPSEQEEEVVVLGRPSGAAATVDAGGGEGQVSLQTSAESAGEAS
jgi:hypothetical protein